MRCMELCFDTKKEPDKYISLRGLPGHLNAKVQKECSQIPVSVSIPTPLPKHPYQNDNGSGPE